MSDKLIKFLVVVFLTLLIWAWAYLTQEQPLSRVGSLEVSPSTDAGLLVTFKLKNSDLLQTRIQLNPLAFRGSPTKISQLLKRYNLPQTNPDRERLDFYYDPAEHGRGPGNYTLDILELLQKDSKIHEMALTLDACTPTQVEVNIEQLELKKLPVACLDENGLPIPGAVADPAFTDIYVRKTYSESATVVLSSAQREVARKTAVSVKPFVKLGVAGIVRESEQPVKITLQSEERLKPQAFQPTSIGFVMSPRLAQRFKPQLENEAQLTSTTQFSATDEAMDAYKKMKYHLLIEVLDGDELLAEIPPRAVIYNFPRAYFKNGEIVELTPPKPAVFKLIPLSPGPAD